MILTGLIVISKPYRDRVKQCALSTYIYVAENIYGTIRAVYGNIYMMGKCPRNVNACCGSRSAVSSRLRLQMQQRFLRAMLGVD